MKRFILCCLFFAVTGCGFQQHSPSAKSHAVSYKAKTVIILVLDGERYSETWGDPTHELVPLLAGDLAPQGVIFENYRNTGITSTVPGHTALASGFYQSIANDGSVLPSHPVIFQLYRKLFSAPASDCWVIASKDKLHVLADSGASGWQGQYTASIDCGLDGLGGGGYRDDSVTFGNLIEILGKSAPRLMIVNLKDPDSAGHTGDWNAYRNALLSCDSYASQLWNFLQSNSRYKDTTALFITNDHGRHLDGVSTGFKDHGDDCDGCRHIMLCVLGPDFRKGTVSAVQRKQTDVTATCAELMGFAIPGSEGNVLTELFQK